MIVSSHTLRQEYRYLDASDPLGEFKTFLPRAREHEYHIDHYEDRFLIRTNDQAKNFRLMSTPITRTGRENWQEIIPHREDVFLGDFEIFRDHLVLEERALGLTQIRLIPWSGGEGYYLAFAEPAYRANLGTNLEFDTTTVRFEYTSMKTPLSVYDYDMLTRRQILLKQEEVLGGFESDNYVTERLYAPAPDGTKIPLSIVYREGTKKDGQNPLLLYGYGSYGFSIDPAFASPRLSLIDRGFVYAIAHVRGGQELGRQWYEDGKLLKKKNTFTDFIACGEYLIRERFTNAEKLFAMGRSAGGLLMGAITNMRPDLFKGIVAEVPFVDVITTMLDPSVPLTTGEYDEWGDPNKKEYYDYMLSYSPYDNVESKNYPNMLVTGGLHDSQVQYWEPAKWVAKLREMKTDNNRLILKTNMDAGHSGASGRFKRHHETAFAYAFLLDLARTNG
jgi:oligopeptidase B